MTADNNNWFFVMPEQYWPTEHAKDEEIFALAEQLDEDLRSGKLREQAQDNRKVLDAIKRAAGVGSVVGDLDRMVKEATKREQIGGVHAPHPNKKQVASTPPIKEEIGGVDTPISQEQVASTGVMSGVDADNRGRPHPQIGGVHAPL